MGLSLGFRVFCYFDSVTFILLPRYACNLTLSYHRRFSVLKADCEPLCVKNPTYHICQLSRFMLNSSILYSISSSSTCSIYSLHHGFCCLHLLLLSLVSVGLKPLAQVPCSCSLLSWTISR